MNTNNYLGEKSTQNIPVWGIGDTDYLCEAKFKSISLASKDIKTQINNEMKSAKKDVNKIQFEDNEKSVSMVFICPSLSIIKKDLDFEIDLFLNIIIILMSKIKI